MTGKDWYVRDRSLSPNPRISFNTAANAATGRVHGSPNKRIGAENSPAGGYAAANEVDSHDKYQRNR